MLKKILVIASLMLAVFAMPAFADFSYYESYDTEKMDTVNMSYYIKSAAGGFSDIKTDKNGNKYYNFGVLQKDDSYTTYDSFLQTQDVDLTKGKFVFGFSVKYNEVLGNCGGFSINLRHADDSTTVNTLYIAADGTTKYFSDYQKSGASVPTEVIDNYKWHKFKFVFDIPNETVTAYRDNKKLLEYTDIKSINSILKNYNYEKIGIRMYTYVSNTFSKDSAGNLMPNKVSLDIDDVYAYNDVGTDENILFSAGEIYEKVDGGLYKITGMRKGNMQLSIVADNISDKDESITILKAIYDETGRMVDFSQSAQMDIKAGASNVLTYDFSSDYNEKDKQMKLMFVNSTGDIRPLSQAKVANGIGNIMPRASQLRADLKNTHPDNDHPRLWITQDKFDELKKHIEANEEPYVKLYNRVISYADAAVVSTNQGLPQYDDADELRLKASEPLKANLMLLSFAYKMTGEEKYVEAVEKQIRNAASWPDWNPNHFLDTACVSGAFGFAYDWCYDYWQKEENAECKELIISKIRDYGLNEAMKAYTSSTASSWVKNWVFVCNSGICQAAVAVMDEPGMEELASKCVAYGLEEILRVTDGFAPDGAWDEGLSYWEYLMMYMTIHFETVQTAFGTDYDYADLPGISQTAYYPMAMVAKQNTVNFHDSYAGKYSSPFSFYFAKQYQNKDFAVYRYKQLMDYNYDSGSTIWLSIADLVWFDPELVADYENYEFEKKDFYFEKVQTTTFRDDYFEKNKVYAALHGGRNDFGHGHLDSGNFIYEYDGIRWAIDLGSENYNLYNMFIIDANKEKSRWSYYRNRAEGHNTVILNPGILADQDPAADTKITYFDANDQQGVSVLDMTPAMKDYASAARRGIKLDKTNGMMLVRDEISFNSDDNLLYWFMHTYANITLSEDKKSAILTDKTTGERLWVGIVDGADLAFTVESAKPLSTSPNPDTWTENMNNAGDSVNPKKQDANYGVKKLQIKAENLSGNFNLTVMLMPLADGTDTPEYIPENLSVDSWIN